MIYCPNTDCAKPRNRSTASFCSHCGTPLRVGDRFLLTEPLGAPSQAFLATDEHLPSRSRCIITSMDELSEATGWSQQHLLNLELLGQTGHLPPMVALLSQPTSAANKPRQAMQAGLGGAVLLAHDWVEGQSLAHRLAENGALDEAELRRCLSQLLESLIQVHEQGFIHGDIRPQTLVERKQDQRCMMVSYGAISPMPTPERPCPVLRQTEDLDALRYWAPERRLGQPLPASDLYSLGVSAVELLTAGSPEQLLDLTEERWQWEESLPNGMSEGLCALLNCLLERSVELRYHSAVEVLHDLQHLNELVELTNLAEPIEAVSQDGALGRDGQQMVAEADAALWSSSASDVDADELAPREDVQDAHSPVKRSVPLRPVEFNPERLNQRILSPEAIASAEGGKGLEADLGPSFSSLTGGYAQEINKELTADLATHYINSLSTGQGDSEETSSAVYQESVAQALGNFTAGLEPAARQLDRPFPLEGEGETSGVLETEAESAMAPAPDLQPDESSSGGGALAEQSQAHLEETLEIPAEQLVRERDIQQYVEPQTLLQSNDPAIEDRSSPLASIRRKLEQSSQGRALVQQHHGPERRQHRRKSSAELVATALDNPLAVPLGALVEQLARRQANQGKPYVPWEIVQSLRQIKKTAKSQLHFATELLKLGDFYRSQASQGKRQARRLVIAVTAYEQALVSLKKYPERWPAVCLDLGLIYMDLSRQYPNHRVACLEQSIQTHRRGLEQVGDAEPLYLELQNQLGDAHSSLAKSQEPLQNWQAAIAAYQAALAACPAELPDLTRDEPVQYNERHGAIQNNLGTAFWNLSHQINIAQQQGLPEVANESAVGMLQEAVSAYNAALAHHDPEADGLRFGMVQNNLGTAYLNLAQFENNLDLMRLAVGSYEVALFYRQRQDSPLAHAATQNNLGAASLQLASHPYADPQTQREALEQSQKAYEQALTLVRELSAVGGAMVLGFDPVATRLNLGLVHQRLGCLEHHGESSGIVFAHLETAMQIYLDLLEKQTKQNDIYEAALEYLSQTLHYLSEHLQVADDHPLMIRVPNHLMAAMSEQFQRQLELQQVF